MSESVKRFLFHPPNWLALSFGEDRPVGEKKNECGLLHPPNRPALSFGEERAVRKEKKTSAREECLPRGLP